MESGHIRITDKVYFEPDGLEKPDINDYEYSYHSKLRRKQSWEKCEYLKDLEKYEASKQLIETDNTFFGEIPKTWYFTSMYYPLNGKIVKDNQPCKAKVTGDKATIVELTKE